MINFVKKTCWGQGAIFLVFILIALPGCQAANDNPNNKCVWFPSLQQPGYLDSNHEYYTSEGSDPYMNTAIGPRSYNTRPQGYDMPRDWARQCAENKSAAVKVAK